MKDGFEEYLDLLDQLVRALADLTALAKEKTAAVRHDDLLGVDDCMKREQVISLKLRSLDARREKLLVPLGLEHTKVSALPAHCPEALRPRAKETADRVRRQYALYRSAAEVARTTLECNLHEIEKRMPGASPPENGVANIRA